MLSYHNDPAIKEKYLARVRAHAADDELIHGTYWQDGKGCAVGCTVHSADHSAYEVELGIPRVLARLEDGIFEGMKNGRSKHWPEQFLSAIEVGRDLSLVWPRFAVWLLTDKWHGVLQYAKTQKAKIAIQKVADAYQSVVEVQKKIDWQKLRSQAYYAYAADAAYAYASAAANAAACASDAAYAAAAAAAAYASAAANAAAYAAHAAYAAKRQEHREAQADKLIELLRSA